MIVIYLVYFHCSVLNFAFEKVPSSVEVVGYEMQMIPRIVNALHAFWEKEANCCSLNRVKREDGLFFYGFCKRWVGFSLNRDASCFQRVKEAMYFYGVNCVVIRQC